MKLVSFFLLITCTISAAELVDAYILCDENEKKLLEETIKKCRQNIPQLSKVFVVSQKKLSENAIWISQANFPFTEKKIQDALKLDKKKKKEKEIQVKAIYQDLLAFYCPFISKNSKDIAYITTVRHQLKQSLNIVSQQKKAYLDFTSGDFDQQEKAPYLHELIPNWFVSIRNVLPIQHHRIVRRWILKEIATKVEAANSEPLWTTVAKTAISYDADVTQTHPTQVLYYYYLLDRRKNAAELRFFNMHCYYNIKEGDKPKKPPKKVSSGKKISKGKTLSPKKKITPKVSEKKKKKTATPKISEKKEKKEKKTATPKISKKKEKKEKKEKKGKKKK